MWNWLWSILWKRLCMIDAMLYDKFYDPQYPYLVLPVDSLYVCYIICHTELDPWYGRYPKGPQGLDSVSILIL